MPFPTSSFNSVYNDGIRYNLNNTDRKPETTLVNAIDAVRQVVSIETFISQYIDDDFPETNAFKFIEPLDCTDIFNPEPLCNVNAQCSNNMDSPTTPTDSPSSKGNNPNFSDLGNLNKHKRRHNGEKPFECRLCGQAFAQKTHLKVHNLTHSSEKLFKCLQTGCNKKFAQPSGLTRHFKKAHG